MLSTWKQHLEHQLKSAKSFLAPPSSQRCGWKGVGDVLLSRYLLKPITALNKNWLKHHIFTSIFIPYENKPSDFYHNKPHLTTYGQHFNNNSHSICLHRLTALLSWEQAAYCLAQWIHNRQCTFWILECARTLLKTTCDHEISTELFDVIVWTLNRCLAAFTDAALLHFPQWVNTGSVFESAVSCTFDGTDSTQLSTPASFHLFLSLMNVKPDVIITFHVFYADNYSYCELDSFPERLVLLRHCAMPRSCVDKV